MKTVKDIKQTSHFTYTADFLRVLVKLDIYIVESENKFIFDVVDITNKLKHRCR